MPTSPANKKRGIVHGYPQLRMIKDSLKTLYSHLSRETIHSFSPCFSPEQAVITSDCDLIIGVQHLAGAIVRHFKLPNGCIIVTFRDLDIPGRVELTSEENYLVDLNSNYRSNVEDIPAILAHEISHVFLHRHGIRHAVTLENEILTDTTAVYLGVGWLTLNAYRVTTRQEHQWEGSRTIIRTETKEEQLGYLTPEEFGYVIEKRALAFREKARNLLTSPAAKQARQAGSELARREYYAAPFSKCGVWKRLKYLYNRRSIESVSLSSAMRGLSRAFDGYQFEFGELLKVVFECPVCTQKLRLPTKKKLQARCGNCKSLIDCTT